MDREHILLDEALFKECLPVEEQGPGVIVQYGCIEQEDNEEQAYPERIPYIFLERVINVF